jgi:hypothetical protein
MAVFITALTVLVGGVLYPLFTRLSERFGSGLRGFVVALGTTTVIGIVLSQMMLQALTHFGLVSNSTSDIASVAIIGFGGISLFSGIAFRMKFQENPSFAMLKR